MKTTTLTCLTCKTDFEKATKELTRRLKAGKTRFYCSMSCGSVQNVEHLRGKYPFIAGSEHQLKANAASIGANTKYFGFDKILSKILRSCRQRKKPFDLDLSYLQDLWQQQSRRCAISNIPLDENATDYIRQPSLDRIDSSLGYVKGNVQFVSCAINLAKSNMSDERIHSLMHLIIEHYKK